MNRNRRNITYSIKVASILKVVISTAILAIAGLSYVYLKNQLQQYGEIQRRLEHDLTEIRTANEAVRVQITQLSSRGVLEKKLAKNSLGLVPIASDQIVRLNQPRDGVGDELRVVSNRGFNR
jgi:cell division protein FtsL